MDRALRISRIAMAVSLILAVTLSLGSAMLLSLVCERSAAGKLAANRPRYRTAAPAAPAGKAPGNLLGHVADDAAGSGNASGGPTAFAAGC